MEQRNRNINSCWPLTGQTQKNTMIAFVSAGVTCGYDPITNWCSGLIHASTDRCGWSHDRRTNSSFDYRQVILVGSRVPIQVETVSTDHTTQPIPASALAAGHVLKPIRVWSRDAGNAIKKVRTQVATAGNAERQAQTWAKVESRSPIQKLEPTRTPNAFSNFQVLFLGWPQVLQLFVNKFAAMF